MRWRAPWRWVGRARWAALGAVWIAGPAQAADPAPILAHIEWQGGDCGDAADFASRILQRTGRVRFVTSAEQLRLRVRIQPQGSALRANVTFSAAGSAPVVRQIESPDCDDALDALALVVAISIDERWRQQQVTPAPRPRAPLRQPARPRHPVRTPAPVHEEERDTTPLEHNPEQASVEMPAGTLEVAAPSPPAPVVRLAPVVPPAAPPDSAGRPWRWASGVGARMLGGAAPSQLFGAELWLRARWERASMFSPQLGLSFSHDRRGGFSEPEGQADFALSSAALELCPLRFGTPRFELSPCATTTFGWLNAAGHRTFRAYSAARPWLTLGAGAQAMATIGSVALRLTGSALHPLQRDGFRFDAADCVTAECGTAPFHRVAPLVWSVGFGAGVAFP